MFSLPVFGNHTTMIKLHVYRVLARHNVSTLEQAHSVACYLYYIIRHNIEKVNIVPYNFRVLS